MTSSRLLGSALLAAMAVAACSVAQVGSPVSSTALPTPSPSPTLNPNQLAGASRSPRPTVTHRPVPSAAATRSATARPTPSPHDAGLEALLPASLRGIPIQRYSTPASVFENGGDICPALCPGEPGRLAAASGVAVDDLSVAIALPDQRSGLRTAIIAIRFPDVATSRLVGIRAASGGHSPSVPALPAATTDLHLGSRTVVWATYPPFFQPEQGEYLVAHDDVLFMIYGDPPSADGTIPADVALAIAALP